MAATQVAGSQLATSMLSQWPSKHYVVYTALCPHLPLAHMGCSFIKEQFGKVPTIGWQLDPFGHSATHAALMCGLLGFDGLFFGRADYQVSHFALS